MIRKLLLALMTALLFVAIPGATFAQEGATPPVACGGLSVEDCDLLVESQQAMSALESYTAQLDLEMSLLDVPNLPRSLVFALSSDGIFHVDPDWLAEWSELQTMSPEEMMENSEAMVELLSELYFAVAFDLTLDVELSRDLAKLISAQAGTALPRSLKLPLRMTNGYFYLNVDDLARVIPEAEGVSGWLGIDLGTLMSESIRQSAGQMQQGVMPANPAMAGVGVLGVQQSAEIQQAINDFIQVERLDDDEVDGVEVARFHSTVDLVGLLSSPMILGLLMDQMRAQMAADPALADEMPVSEADMETLSAMAPMMLPMLLGDFEAETLTSIGLEDKYVYATETHVRWDLASIAAMATAMTQGGGMRSRPGGGDAPVYSFHLFVTNADFNSAPEIEAPADAIIIPLDALEAGPIM